MTSANGPRIVAPLNPAAHAEWNILEYSFSRKSTSSTLVAWCNQRRVVVELCAENFENSPEVLQEYIFFLRVAENVVLEGFSINHFYEWIYWPMKPLLQELCTLDATPNRGIQTFLFPETRVYTLCGEGEVSVVAHECDIMPPGEAKSLYGIAVDEFACEPWTCYDPTEVHLPDNARTITHTPTKVELMDGTKAFLKLLRPGDELPFRNEVATYATIHAAQLDPELRVPRLLGIVQARDQKVYGLLLTFIDCKYRTLSISALMPFSGEPLWRKWAEQIEDTLLQLHDAGIIWGDAKPDNVLVDKENSDAWLIDFGGGRTDGWVPPEWESTREGDLRALRKIKSFLGV